MIGVFVVSKATASRGARRSKGERGRKGGRRGNIVVTVFFIDSKTAVDCFTASIFVLEEQGVNISAADLGDNPVFVLGDHVGLPRKDEKFALRYGKKISLGKKPYLAATCVDVINYFLDRRAKGE